MGESKFTSEAKDSSFGTEIEASKGLVLVDFWAEWCGPCRMLGPKIEEVASENQGKVKVFKMNVDENPNTPGKFNIRGIPTVILFKDGKAVETIVGNQDKNVFTQAITKHL
jgi:thioredoxin 1